jgi:hypothetical protein
MKVRAAGYIGPLLIVGDASKGREIDSWREPQHGWYDVTAEDAAGRPHHLQAKSAVLLDDKAKAFQNIPSNCRGFWLQRSEEMLASQRGEVPSSVAIIHSLNVLGFRGGQMVVLEQEEREDEK